MLETTLIITFSVLTTCFINYKLFTCIKRTKYDDIPELNEIKKRIEKENKKNDKVFEKIINDVDIDEDFYIVKEVELQNNKD